MLSGYRRQGCTRALSVCALSQAAASGQGLNSNCCGNSSWRLLASARRMLPPQQCSPPGVWATRVSPGAAARFTDTHPRMASEPIPAVLLCPERAGCAAGMRRTAAQRAREPQGPVHHPDAPSPAVRRLPPGLRVARLSQEGPRFSLGLTHNQRGQRAAGRALASPGENRSVESHRPRWVQVLSSRNPAPTPAQSPAPHKSSGPGD